VTAWLVVAALGAGALGALARYGITRAVAARLPADRLPLAVLIANAAGSLLAGAVFALPGADELRLVLVGGFAGGLTPFSTWTVETVQLVLAGRTRAAVGNVAANLAAGIAAAAAGYAAVWGALALTA